MLGCHGCYGRVVVTMVGDGNGCGVITMVGDSYGACCTRRPKASLLSCRSGFVAIAIVFADGLLILRFVRGYCICFFAVLADWYALLFLCLFVLVVFFFVCYQHVFSIAISIQAMLTKSTMDLRSLASARGEEEEPIQYEFDRKFLFR